MSKIQILSRLASRHAVSEHAPAGRPWRTWTAGPSWPRGPCRPCLPFRPYHPCLPFLRRCSAAFKNTPPTRTSETFEPKPTSESSSSTANAHAGTAHRTCGHACTHSPRSAPLSAQAVVARSAEGTCRTAEPGGKRARERAGEGAAATGAQRARWGACQRARLTRSIASAAHSRRACCGDLKSELSQEGCRGPMSP